MEEISKREIPTFVEIEEMIYNNTITIEKIKEIMTNSKYNIEDQIRLCIIYIYYPKTTIDRISAAINRGEGNNSTSSAGEPKHMQFVHVMEAVAEPQRFEAGRE